jgi:hypothetical protein
MAGTPAQLIITFTAQGVVDDNISFKQTNQGITNTAVCKDARSSSGQFAKGTDAITAATNFETAMNLDYALAYNTTRVGAVVTIEGTADDYSFENIVVPIAYATYALIPNTPDTAFRIDTITVSETFNTSLQPTQLRYKCNLANTTGGNAPPYDLLTPVEKLNITDVDDVFYNFDRQGGSRAISINVVNSPTGASGATPTADLFTIDSVTVNEASQGATVIINLNLITGEINTTREYSINGTEWYPSPQFTGQSAGSYTAYVRDEYMPSEWLSMPYTVEGGVGVDKPEPFFDIPKANPLQFVNNELIGIPNLDNALFETILQSGYYPNVDYRYYSQIIANGDNIVTQVRNNYDNVIVEIINCATEEVAATPSFDLKVNSIAKEDDRDCTVRSASDGKAVVYFESGNTYTPEAGTYANPTGGLFAFAKLGKRFTISGSSASNGVFDPIESYFDKDLSQWGIKLDVTYAGTINGDFGRCLTVYDERQWNTYEFDTSYADLTLGQTYYTKITATDPDPRYNDVEWISEPLTAISDVSNTTVFDYRNAGENTADIDFTTNVTFRLRVYGRFMRGNNNLDVVDPFVSDLGKKVISKSISTRFVKFESMLIPYYATQKISILSGMDTLNINNHPYALV